MAQYWTIYQPIWLSIVCFLFYFFFVLLYLKVTYLYNITFIHFNLNFWFAYFNGIFHPKKSKFA